MSDGTVGSPQAGPASDLQGLCIHDLFEAQVRRTPEAMAVRCDGRSLTYAELNRRADRLAHQLRENGAGPEVLTGVFLGRSLDFAVALIAILKAGGVVVPIDPDLPAERLAFIMAETRMPVVVTDLVSRSRLPENDARVLCFGVFEEDGHADLPRLAVDPDNLAWVLYTSGSTGRPKGVMLTHAAYLEYFRGAVDYLGLGPDDHYLQFAAFSFDTGVDQLLTPLLVGASVEMRGSELWHPMVLADSIYELGLTVVHLPSAYWNEWVEVLVSGLCRDVPERLRLVQVGGDVMSLAAARAWAGLGLKSVRLINRYGPTESTMFSTAYEVPDDLSALAWLPRIPIGKLFGSRCIRLLDANRQSVPDGEVGEIFIGGGTLARGYFNRPELTAERFIPDPWSATEGARLYRTGDLARLLPDGNLDFLGRADFQVKFRGFRIELEEIDQVMKQYPGVREAVTIVRTDALENQWLVTCVVLRNQAVVERENLRLYAKDRMPEYMIPARFVILDRLPLTPNGKADRQALRRLESTEFTPEGDRIEPRHPLEARLAELWQSTLGISKVGVLDDFLDLGGHSLLAMRLISRLNREFKVQLTVRQFMEARNIQGLAGLLGHAGGEGQAQMEPVRRERPPRLSFGQERLWFLSEYEPESTAYTLPRAWRLVGDLCFSALERALALIVQRHDSLRTTFRMIDGEPEQIIATFEGFTLPVVDLSDRPRGGREPELRHLLAVDQRLAFDLARGPLFRTRLIRLDQQTHVLSCNQHHVISDGWSLGVFCQELACHYNAFKNAEASPLLPLAVQYADYAVWQREWMEGEVLDGHARYWLPQLVGAPVLEMPLDRPRPAQVSPAGATVSIMLSAALAANLSAFNRELAVTPFMSLLAVFQILMSRYSGQTDFLVAVPIANRQRVEVEELIGFFVNTLVMRVDLAGDPGFVEVVRRGRRVAMDAFEHQDFPFEELVKKLNPARDLSRHPLCQVLFALQNAPYHPLELAGLEVMTEPMSGAATPFDLELHFWQRGEEWNGRFIYNTGLFDAATIERMAGHYVTLLESLLGEPHRSIRDVPMLAVAERLQLLVEWNATAIEFPREKCLHQLFEEQAERTPEVVAVEMGCSRLTYRELNEQADQLSCELRERGIRPDVQVGVCLERSLGLVVCLLGVLKAGAAYLPLDPGIPVARIALMLGEATVAILITQRSLVGQCGDFAGQWLWWDDWTPSGGAVRVASSVSPRNAAYVMFTSGSTGRPKGVVLEHRSVVNLLHSLRAKPGLEAGDVMLAVTTVSFDISVLEIFLPLTVGARVVMVSDRQRADGAALVDLLADSGATVMQGTPATWQLLLMAGWKGDGRLKALVGGEALSVELAARLLERCGEVWNLYGPTETTVYSLGTRIEHSSRITIGTPLPNTRVYVVDAAGQLVPAGVPGELWLGGEGVARGYLNHPEMTAEKFRPDPFQAESTARVYRTGDRCRWRPDGSIDFLGRMDRQVKIRGYRIELEEVETTLRSEPEIAEAVVMMRESGAGDKYLVAFLVATPMGRIEARLLRERLGASLPHYMIPSAFIWLECLPLTPAGKLDRLALPQSAEGGAEGRPDENRPDDQNPINLLELKLTVIWKRLFERDDIGRRDDFFALGGHSLLAARLVVEMAKEFGSKVAVSTLFQSPTIELLARRFANENWLPPSASLVPLKAQGTRPPLFFVHGWGGSVFGFLELARQLPADQPCYGMQAVGLDGRVERHLTVEAMAEHYVREIISFQPAGAVSLAGYSMGGMIAFEVARQLRGRGRRVAMLALLDTSPVGRIPLIFHALKMALYVPRRLRVHIRTAWALPLKDRMAYVSRRRLSFFRWLRRSCSPLPVVKSLSPVKAESAAVPGFADYYLAVASAYDPGFYPGGADVFVSETADPVWRWYWRYLIKGGVTFHQARGDHIEMLRSPENLPALAHSLNEVLRRAQSLDDTASTTNPRTHARPVS